MENVLKILGMIEDVIKKLENIIFQDGLRDVLNNIVPLNKQKQDVKELIETVLVSHSGKEDGELEPNIDLQNLAHKKPLSYINVNPNLNVIKEVIMFIFPHWQEVELYNITTLDHVSELVTVGEIHVKVVHYIKEDME